VYVARPVLFVLFWSRLFRVSSSVSGVRYASPVRFISRSRSAGLWGLEKLRLKEREPARGTWVDSTERQQRLHKARREARQLAINDLASTVSIYIYGTNSMIWVFL
jgi:hypothetical protein